MRRVLYEYCQKVYQTFPWKRVLVVVISFLLIFLSGYYAGRKSLRVDGNRTDSTAEQFDRAAATQRTLTNRTEEAAQRAGDVENRISRSEEAVNRAEESAGRIDSGIQEAGSLIEDSQRILERVRQRGKAN